MKGDPPKKKNTGTYKSIAKAVSEATVKVMSPKVQKKVANAKKKVKTKVLKYKASKADSVKNPKNEPFVTEVAFNKGKSKDKVTQEEFNKRYGIKY